MRRYSFCPVCGAPYDEAARKNASLLECTSCGFQFWQNSKPTVGALVTRVRDGRPEVLLCRRGILPKKGSWDLPGGFLENGETPPDGVAREIAEELGPRPVRVIRLVFADVVEYPQDDQAEEARFALALYYRCEIGLDSPLRAADDVAGVRWYPLDALPADLAFPADARALRDLAREELADSRPGAATVPPIP